MCAPFSLKLTSGSPDHTCQIARALAGTLTRGDVILLQGDVGAGKTHFARCLIQSLLPICEDVPSPTYTLVQTYAAGACDIWHADLYRLTDMSEVEELGLMEAFEEAIVLIEWPDRLAELTPQQALTIHLSPGDAEETRIMACTWHDPRWTGKLEALNHV